MEVRDVRIGDDRDLVRVIEGDEHPADLLQQPGANGDVIGGGG